jgi:YD repeat-containing protein
MGKNSSTYDMENRLLGMASIVSSYQYTLDENGNRINSAESEPLAATPPEAATSYGYNAQKNRLLSAGAFSYTYDNDGQLASTAGTAYAFNYDHRLAEIGTSTQFSYDGRGNRLSATRAGITRSYINVLRGNLLAHAD